MPPATSPRPHQETLADLRIPASYKQDLERALAVFFRFGCSEVYLFGSLAEGRSAERSDIDFVVGGCPKGEFFRLYGRLTMELQHSVDLVSMEYQRPFVKLLQEHGGLLRLA